MTAVHALLLPVGSDLYALPISWAREVVRAPSITPLPTAPAMVIGLFNLRGEIVPLLDTAAVLGIGQVTAIEFGVVLGSPQGPVGLATTGPPQRGLLDTQVASSELWGTSGLYRVEDRVAALLDPAVLLAPDHVRGPARTDLAARER